MLACKALYEALLKWIKYVIKEPLRNSQVLKLVGVARPPSEARFGQNSYYISAAALQAPCPFVYTLYSTCTCGDIHKHIQIQKYSSPMIFSCMSHNISIVSSIALNVLIFYIDWLLTEYRKQWLKMLAVDQRMDPG